MRAELSLALAAGLVAAFNPCGFALLPSYLTLLIAGDDSTGLGAVGRALRLAAAMTAGFIAVFGIFGVITSTFAESIEQHLPWATIVIGIGLIALGGWLLSGRELLLRLPRLRASAPTTAFVSQFTYGVSYAIASLSCTFGPFFVVAGAAFESGDVVKGSALFVAYGVGMGLVIGLLSVLVALARGAAVARTRRILPYVSRVSGGLLVLAGAYVTYYGWYETRVNAGKLDGDPVVDFTTRIQGRIEEWLRDLGATWIAVAFALVLATTLTAWALHRRRHPEPAPPAPEASEPEAPGPAAPEPPAPAPAALNTNRGESGRGGDSMS